MGNSGTLTEQFDICSSLREIDNEKNDNIFAIENFRRNDKNCNFLTGVDTFVILHKLHQLLESDIRFHKHLSKFEFFFHFNEIEVLLKIFEGFCRAYRKGQPVKFFIQISKLSKNHFRYKISKKKSRFSWHQKHCFYTMSIFEVNKIYSFWRAVSYKYYFTPKSN